MTASVVRTLLARWQPWCQERFPGEPSPVTSHLLGAVSVTSVPSRPVSNCALARWVFVWVGVFFLFITNLKPYTFVRIPVIVVRIFSHLRASVSVDLLTGGLG